MAFQPVTTFDDLDGLDHDQMVEGYASAERGDPEPGENRGRSYWHGWRCRMMDYGLIASDEGHRRLVREYLAHQRAALASQRGTGEITRQQFDDINLRST